jgi:hypothetical protein
MPVLPRPRKGVLMGYHYVMPVGKRRVYVMQAIKRESPLKIGRHLLLLSTLTKSTIPTASKIYKKNSKWAFSKINKTKQNIKQL